MEWEYKGVEISVNESGMFEFYYASQTHCHDTLKGAKLAIDSLVETYSITVSDIELLLEKLDKKERDFVIQLIVELGHHEDNAYCQLGITDDFPFDMDFEKILKELSNRNN